MNGHGTGQHLAWGRTMRRRVIAAIACVLAAAFVSACGGGDDDGDGTTSGADGGKVVKAPGARLIDWTLFGRTLERTHYLPAPERLNPPLTKLWSYNDRALLEFPPAVSEGVAFVANKYGNVRAIDLPTRKILWDIQRDKRDTGPPSDVTAPVWSDHMIFVAFESGTLVALREKDGSVIWKRDMKARLESSPAVDGDALYIGTDKTNLVSLDANNGKVRWSLNTPAPIKASPSLSKGRVIVGDYAGTIYSVDAVTGKLDWATDTTKVGPGGAGGFYSSPAVDDGTVFEARDDGTVFAVDQDSGKLKWSFETGGAVYGSPAVADVPGTPLTVYIGSYDGKLYAINAKTGKKEWDFKVGGSVPGTATVIGHTVYTSSFATGKSIGVDALTHKKTFSVDSPGYTPMISDGQNLYLIGYYSVKGYKPK